MRWLGPLMCACALAMMPVSGCGDTQGTGGSGGIGGNGGNGGDGGAGGHCPDPNYPPSIISQPGAAYPLNQIGQLDLDEPAEPAELPLEVIIRDPNVEQTLEYRIFLDAPPPPATEVPIDQGQIEPTGLLERLRTFGLAYDMLEPGHCHKVELVVVGAFTSVVEPRRPVEEGDIHEVAWWIEVTDTDNPIISRTCR